MARTGRPKAEIDWNQFDKLCKMQCTLVEMASWFEVDTKTLERRVKSEFNETFSVVHKRKSDRGKISIRHKLFQLGVEDGVVPVLLYLDRKYLNGLPGDIQNRQPIDVTVENQTIQAIPLEAKLKLLEKALNISPPEESAKLVVEQAKVG